MRHSKDVTTRSGSEFLNVEAYYSCLDHVETPGKTDQQKKSKTSLPRDPFSSWGAITIPSNDEEDDEKATDKEFPSKIKGKRARDSTTNRQLSQKSIRDAMIEKTDKIEHMRAKIFK